MGQYRRSGTANKALVLTLPALSSFDIRARYKSFVLILRFLLPVRARAGRTMQALALCSPIIRSFDCCRSHEMTFMDTSHGGR